MNFSILKYGFLIVLVSLIESCRQSREEIKKPNILLIYMDDLGYGDVSSYGVGTLSTPNIDRISENGIRFTNGYSTSATCTPSRYAILSGEYPWRNQRAQILPGNAPLLFDISKETLPSLLKKVNYKTAIIGKWHLGLGDKNLDWNQSISPGPNDIGFDYSFILASTNDRVPSVYLENNKVLNLNKKDPLKVSYTENFIGEPTGKENPQLLKLFPSHGHDMSIHNGISRIGFMKGGKSALYIDENMSDTILVKTKKFIESNKDNPFFLFYSLHQPHVPRVPHPRFVGSSGMGPRGDAILEADWAIGQVLDKIDELGLSENTMVVFSSDNGPVLNDGYYDDSDVKNGDHLPSGPFRGGKYSLFEAGTRVPFFTYWKGKIKPGVSDSMVSQLDLLSSLAQLVGSEVRTADSLPLLELLMGQSDEGRDEMVIEATSRTAFKRGDWVMIPPYEGPAVNDNVQIELGNDSDFQLYNLNEDIEQQNNLAPLMPGKLQEMLTAFEAIRGDDYGEIEKLELK